MAFLRKMNFFRKNVDLRPKMPKKWKIDFCNEKGIKDGVIKTKVLKIKK